MNNKIDLSIVIPCYNEEKNIPFVVMRFLEVHPSNLPCELILVDNGSQDATQEVLKELARKYSFIKIVTIKKNEGYGNGIWKGLQAAKGDFLCWTHADLETDLKDVFIALEQIKQQQNPKNCFIKGNRKNRPFFDSFFTFCMSLFETILLRKILYDINAQPNLFHKRFLEFIKNPPSDFSFDLYMYYMAKKQGYTIVRFPVIFKKRLHGTSSWNTCFTSKWKFIKKTVLFTMKLKKQLDEDMADA